MEPENADDGAEFFVAVLLRGERYSLAKAKNGSELVFEHGIGRIISAETKAYLEETAVDDVLGELDESTGTREVISKAKLSYEPYSGPLGIGDLAEAVTKPRRAGVVAATAPKSRKQKAA